MRTRTICAVRATGLILWTATVALPQSIITTIAGTDFTYPVQPLPALNAPLGNTQAVAVDARGNLYVADTDNSLILKLDQQGILTVVAGNGHYGFSGDGGPATAASLESPWGVAVDTAGNLFIAEVDNFRIRKVTPDGIITTVAGSGFPGFAGDGGPATSASLAVPEGAAVDAAGNLFIADLGNNRIRKVTPGGIITTVAGNGFPSFSGDGGPATSASLHGPSGVAVDAAGNLFIADYFNNRIRKITPGGIISTVAGSGAKGFSGDGGPATSASLATPSGVVVDAGGNLFIADEGNNRIRKITPGGAITTVAGNGAQNFSGDGGPATSASLGGPRGVAVDAAGSLFIADKLNDRIRKITLGGTITTVAGNGIYRFAGDGKAAVTAVLNNPSGLAPDATGNLFVADTNNNRIRKITPGGTITTVAGGTAYGFSGDGGPATSALLNNPSGVAVDAAGNLFIADLGRIRKVTLSGIITTVAGTGAGGPLGDGGPATSASLGPSGLAIDAAGNLFVADYSSHRIRKVTPSGTITTVAGNGVAGFSGDGGPATSASLNYPTGTAVDAAGNLFIADQDNNRVRKVTPGGTITTVAGNGSSFDFFGDGGPATYAALAWPAGVAVDAAGNLFIADYLNNRIRKVTPSGVITTVAGNGVLGFNGDGGPATYAALAGPAGVAVDTAGNLFIADRNNSRIRVALSAPPSYQATPTNLNVSTSDAPGTQSINLSSVIAGLAYTASTDVPWLSLTPASGSMPSVLQVSFDPTSLTPDSIPQATITITAPNSVPAVRTIPVTLTIVFGGPVPGSLAVSSQSVSFAAIQGAGPSAARLTVSNQGGGSIGFTAAFSTATGGNWLQVSPASGSLTPGSPVPLIVTADPSSLGVGTFHGTILLSSSNTGQQLSIPVTLAITAAPQKILLSQTGLTFTAVAQGGKPLPQSFGILNIGQGSMSWTATATTLSGNSGWLTIDQATRNGTVTQPFTDVSTVNVLVDPAGLSPGDYYGQIQVASIAANSPQSVSVAVTILPLNSTLPPELRPAGLIFTGTAGVTPGSQDVQIGNPAAQPTDYLSGVIGAAFTIEPTNATVQPNQPAILRVYPDFSKLAPATVLRGTITLQFSDGTPKTVSVLTVVSPNATGLRASPREPAPRDVQTTCPSQLFPVFTELGSSGAVPAGWPQTIAVKVVDDCGLPMTAGSVFASFSNGDPGLTLNNLQNGTWTGTWQPRNVNANTVQVTVKAQLPNAGPAGSVHQSIGLQGSKTLPVLSGGPLSPVTLTEGPLAPGDLVLIRGTNLADAPSTASSPAPQLAGASVLVGGRTLSLFYADDSQLVGQMPMDLPVNTDEQIFVQHGTSLGLGVPLTVAPSHPAILAIYDISGATPILVDDGHPAAAGDTVILYCSGLGGVDPNGVLSNLVSVSIGDQNAVSSYAGPALPQGYPPSGPPTILGGLASTGLGGLYQITVTVPSGLPAGPAPVVVSSGGQSSQAGINMSIAGSH
jgi:uncharacterized protein (TIGR03437 family)